MKNTIIVLWSDHGYHLGDHGMWCKHTNYEQSTKVPLFVVDPSAPESERGQVATSPVELVDIFATLCDLAGLPKADGIEGTSLKQAMVNPRKQIKPYAVSQFHRYYVDREIMGYAWRDERYRYIEWIDMRFKEGGREGPVVDRELYDYLTDPAESRNLIHDSAYADVLDYMERKAAVYK